MAEKKKSITIRDIAQKANVSYQTVSLVINNKPGVSENTRKRILHLMDELDYQPNRAAQMLTTNRSNTIELIIVDVNHPGHLASTTKKMAHAAKNSGYSLLVSETESSGLGAALDNAVSRLVDGIILYAPKLRIADDKLKELCNGLPFVRRDYVPGSRVAWVAFDQVYATRMAVEHLIELGHKQIAAIPPTSDLINGYWRFTTWKNVLHEYGLEPGPYFDGDYSMRSGYEAAQRILETGMPFTGLIVGTDNMALSALRALREHGLQVPRDISVISFDNAEHSAYTEPPLTTIDFQFARQDELVVKYLLEIINDPNTELHQRVLMPDLLVRESTRRLD